MTKTWMIIMTATGLILIGCNNPAMNGDGRNLVPKSVETVDGSGTLADFGWTGTDYEVVDGEFLYTGDYSVPAVFRTPAFSVSADSVTKVVVEMDFNLDMSAAELNSLKGERVKFWFDFGPVNVIYKARVPSDTGNKHIRMNDHADTEFTGYMSTVDTWYNLRMEIFGDGSVGLYLDDVLVVSDSVAVVDFDSLAVTYRALTNSVILPQIKFRNISIREAGL